MKMKLIHWPKFWLIEHLRVNIFTTIHSKSSVQNIIDQRVSLGNITRNRLAKLKLDPILNIYWFIYLFIGLHHVGYVFLTYVNTYEK
jgi:hypothetical protein